MRTNNHDVLTAEAEAPVREVRLPEPAGASPTAIRRAVEILGEAERPIAVVGSGAFWAGAGRTVYRWDIANDRLGDTATEAVVLNADGSMTM